MLAAQSLLQHHRLLMLQGPMGGFFNQLADWLQANGIETRKVNFNGGDWLFHRRPGTIHYQGRMSAFSRWLRSYIQREGIDALICFGDCRRHHRVAFLVAKELGIEFYAFEEGYLRPDYITLEEGGVNAFSKLATDPERYLQHEPSKSSRPEPTYPSFKRMAISAMAYYTAGWLLQKYFPHYRHHKDFSPFRECFNWIRAGYRKKLYRFTEAALIHRITGQWQNQYFLVALQVFNDSQIRQHSPYEDVCEFIAEVIHDFSRHAHPKHKLVFKHHPMDCGHRHYGDLIKKQARAAGIFDRVHYVHDAHLPTMIQHSLGVVMINSTVGMSALFHGRPLITLGRAFYDIPGLTFQHGLSRFWNEPYVIDKSLYHKLRSYMIKHTQLNGAFFGLSHWMHHPKLMPRNQGWHTMLRFSQLTALTLLIDGGCTELMETCMEWFAVIG
ncbi:capsular biosynthesis protein [Chromobacterium amazonense]|uniref:Capsular biosynthesis protein n=1 Tax=Chromobacterium amazonense TaxID=1382803 RepID=A0ABU8V8Q0_9NEIS|nr:capsular biosynthesis protein [Chromobacterium amazonense]MDQ4540595.1 capsular biosynthesis protein [Chromobacterium amazonense]